MRTISLGQIDLTHLRGYRWEITVATGGNGTRHAVVTEVYVVTDTGYTTVPEGQQRRILALTPTQQTTLDNLFKSKQLAAAARESVDIDPELGL